MITRTFLASLLFFLPALAWAAPIDARALTLQLYADHPAPFWMRAGQAPARTALRLLAAADTHGLDPAQYGVAQLAARLAGPLDAAAEAMLDRDLSAAMLQYLADLHGGRAAPGARVPASAGDDFDPVRSLRSALAAGGPEAAIAAAVPALPLYGRVVDALAHYRQLVRSMPPWPALPPAARASLRPGDAYPGAAQLRARLRLLGDLDAGAESDDDTTYSAALAAAVRRFQARHGLEADGVPGRQTLAALAVPPTHRAAQLALTLERLRWLPPPPRGRVIAINIPTYRLWAFDLSDANAAPPLEMRVIVGTAVRTPTPLFIGQMRYLELNPYWNVPRSIQMGDIVPRLARDPGYLERNDMELVARDGQVVHVSGSTAVARLRAGTVRVRQRPGRSNVLGAVKFAMPNPMNIYLHSTATPALFARARRDLSHGCIRIEHPAQLAQFVLADPQRWDHASVAAAMAPGPPRTVALPAPVPVVLFYATALVDRDGRVLFAQDIYGRDQALIAALGLDQGLNGDQ